MEWSFTFCAPTISNRQMSSGEISSSLSLSSLIIIIIIIISNHYHYHYHLKIIIIIISNQQMSSGEIIISSCFTSPSSLSYLRYWPRLPSFIICDHPLFQAAPFDRPRSCQASQLPRYWACASSSSWLSRSTSSSSSSSLLLTSSSTAACGGQRLYQPGHSGDPSHHIMPCRPWREDRPLYKVPHTFPSSRYFQLTLMD